jgi:fused signal recognition particle receptor
MPLDFLKSLVQKFTGRPVDWDEVEEMFIRSDLGVPMTQHILAGMRDRKDLNAETMVEVARDKIVSALPVRTEPLEPLPGRPKVVMLVGVNGTGKTTSAAKLAKHLLGRGHTALLVAADTFRAAAIEQLGVWGQRLGVEVVKGQYGGDPAALCYDAYTSAARRGVDFLICDTAGRLHTKDNLMQELAKTTRSLAKHDPGAPHEKLLVVDATTGSNALVQAREFHEAVGLTGLIVTKLDGSGKGGVLVAIQHELGIPTRFLGTGEKVEDFAAFDRERFGRDML